MSDEHRRQPPADEHRRQRPADEHRRQPPADEHRRQPPADEPSAQERPADEPSAREMGALVGRRFPGGTRRIERWESWLLTDCTAGPQLPDGLVHPIALFHVPIQGAQTSIAELFEWGRVSGAGSVGLDGYDWRYPGRLHVDVDYQVEGGVTEVERVIDGRGRTWDRLVFSIALSDHDGVEVARATNHWRLRRVGIDEPAPGMPTVDPTRLEAALGLAGTDGDPGAATSAGGSELIPEWAVGAVDAQRMKTMAALLRDPYAVHWDRQANEALGLGGRTINQGPLNVGYIANMLMAWQGPDSIRRLTVTFRDRVLDGEAVIARGQVRSVIDADGERRAICDVRLDRGAEAVVVGRAEVTLSP